MLEKSEHYTTRTALEKLPSKGVIAPRPPTVLQVLPALVAGGVERGTVDITGAIVQGGGRAIVASAGGPMMHEVTRLGGEHVELPVNSKNPLVMRANIGRLVELILRENIDVIHARSRAPAWSSWFAARRTNKHFVTTFHGAYEHGNILKHYYNSVMTKGEKVIAISDFIAGHIRKVYGVSASKLSVIPRGVDLSDFDPKKISKERIIEQAQKWRLPDGIPVVMLPGRLTRWKGQSVFIKAIKQLERKDFQCLIVGSDQGRYDYRQELVNQINGYGLSDVIHVIDHCEDMPAAYMLTDIVVSASTEPEAFGRVAVEAQALGRPVIATDHGGACETVLDGKTGWLTPPGDVEALASIIEQVLAQSGEERKKFSERTIRHIRENFSKEKMCEQTLEVYNTILASETI